MIGSLSGLRPSCNMTSAAAEFDLTGTLVKYLDRHLIFPLLEFLSQKRTYPEDDIQKSKLDLLQKTNMVDYGMDIYRALYNKEDVPEDMKNRRHEVVQNMKNLQVQALPLSEAALLFSKDSDMFWQADGCCTS